LTARLEKTALSEKMIEQDLSWVEENATKSTYRLGVRFERYENVRSVLPSLFLALPTTKRKQQSNPPKLTIHPTQSHPSIQREKQGKKPQAERGSFCMHVLWPCWSLG
jgi:hypothetical protein